MKPIDAGEVASVVAQPVIEIQDFDQVVERHWPRVLRFLLAAVRDSDLAESLTQDCFLKAYRNRMSFRGESSVNTWLMSIAVNLVRDHTRSRRFQFWNRARQSALDSDQMRNWIPDKQGTPEQKAMIGEQVQAIWTATQHLSERQRSVFLLRFLEDLDIPEIAEATGLTENAVGVHLFRAVRAIRKLMRRTDG